MSRGRKPFAQERNCMSDSIKSPVGSGASAMVGSWILRDCSPIAEAGKDADP